MNVKEQKRWSRKRGEAKEDTGDDTPSINDVKGDFVLKRSERLKEMDIH